MKSLLFFQFETAFIHFQMAETFIFSFSVDKDLYLPNCYIVLHPHEYELILWGKWRQCDVVLAAV